MSDQENTFPLSTRHTHEVTCTPRWYVQYTEYHPVLCTYEPLINGEEAFREVHLAIAAATRSVDIICWGFQPSMYFIRDHYSPCIGELLRMKASQGVRVRVLGWELAGNLAGLGGEANLPGKFPNLGGMALQNATKQQHEYDKQWFREHAGDLSKIKYIWAARKPVFVSRGFDTWDRIKIGRDALLNASDKELSAGTIHVFMASATHHQKTVLVDYEDPANAVGFVMGHNMLDEYWDTNAHSARNRTQHDWPAPNAGARGFTPRQDISSKVTGPILEHLHHNFAKAWKAAFPEDLMILRDAKRLACDLKCGDGTWQIAQLLRTQAQEGKRDIEKVYMQAVNNATQFIYIENQYFRWPPLAEKIKQVALTLSAAGKDPGMYGALHLFVVTNVTDDGIGAGTVNTQRMLECLGRADTIPGITKFRRVEALLQTPEAKAQMRSRNPAHHEALAKEIKDIQDSLVNAEDIPGLKVHICSLVAKDSPAGAWMPVYIHSKLMIVDDVFTTHGSANVNTRSMQVDSELNIAHEWVTVTEALRRKLWALHTDGKGAQDDPVHAFREWDKIIIKNKDRMSADGIETVDSPYAPLIEFLYKPVKLSNLD